MVEKVLSSFTLPAWQFSDCRAAYEFLPGLGQAKILFFYCGTPKDCNLLIPLALILLLGVMSSLLSAGTDR